MIGNYPGRPHITEASADPAPPRTDAVQPGGGYVSPTVQRHAEMRARQAEDAARDRYRVPETREQLLAMKSADMVRTYEQHRETYDRLMGHA